MSIAQCFYAICAYTANKLAQPRKKIAQTCLQRLRVFPSLSCAGIRASYARQVRVNIVPESVRHLQMTRTRQMRMKCASSARESCARIRASFTNDAYASNARHLCTRTRSLPEAIMGNSILTHQSHISKVF